MVKVVRAEEHFSFSIQISLVPWVSNNIMMVLLLTSSVLLQPVVLGACFSGSVC